MINKNKSIIMTTTHPEFEVSRVLGVSTVVDDGLVENYAFESGSGKIQSLEMVPLPRRQCTCSKPIKVPTSQAPNVLSREGGWDSCGIGAGGGGMIIVAGREVVAWREGKLRSGGQQRKVIMACALYTCPDRAIG